MQIPAIYIHAKLILIDDVFTSIGSTNFNRRSMEHDGELHAFALPQALKRDPLNPALRLRCRLWAEHLGLPPEMGLSLLADPAAALDLLRPLLVPRKPVALTARRARSGRGPGDPDARCGQRLHDPLGIAEGLILDIDKAEIWAGVVDPTTPGDPFVDPAQDRGPVG